MDFDLTLGSAGATLAGLSPRLYFDGVPVALPAGAVLSPVVGSIADYVLTGLPDAPSGSYRLTYEFPEGVWGSLRWGGRAVPREIIVPVRVAGLDAAALDLVVLRNGEITAVTMTVGEVGAPGDYRVAGWPAAEAGERWTLRWSYGGIYGSETWRSPAGIAGTRMDLDDRALAAFTARWRAKTPPAPLLTMPHVSVPGGGFRPKNQEPYVDLDLLMDRGEEFGPVGMKTYDLTGFLQASLHVKDGDGRLLTTKLLALAVECLEEMTVQGLKVYGGRKPYDLPTPPPGYYGRAVDAPCRYVGP